MASCPVNFSVSDSLRDSFFARGLNAKDGTNSTLLDYALGAEKKGDLPKAIDLYLSIAEEHGIRFYSVAKRVILKAEELARQAHDPMVFAQFLERLDEKLLIALSLKRLLDQKKAIRSVFNEAIEEIHRTSPIVTPPSCFICFNVDEPDVKSWVLKVLIPDLKALGVTPIYSPIDLKVGDDLADFESRAGQEDFVIVMCTPSLKKKCEEKLDSGVAREIAIIKERNRNTIIPLFFKGSRLEGSPLPDSVFGLYVTSYSYYSVLRAFMTLRGHQKNDLEKSWIVRINEKAKELLRSYRVPLSPPLFLHTRPYVALEGVPFENRYFVRRKEVDIEGAFQQNKVVVLTQSPGTLSRNGKTQVAIDYARKATQYDRVVWVDASKQKNLQGLDFSKSNTLFILDNAPHLPPDVFSNLQGNVLITSRHADWEKAAVITIPSFSKEEALELFQRMSKCYDAEDLQRKIVSKFENIPSLIARIVRSIYVWPGIYRHDLSRFLYENFKAKKYIIARKGNVPFIEEIQGRWHEVEFCDNWFGAKKGPLFLSGIGKTAFAKHYAIFRSSDYDVLGYIRCDSPSSRLSSYRELADRLGLKGPDPEKKVHAYIEGKKGLIIFDNVCELDSLPNFSGDAIVISTDPPEKALHLPLIEGKHPIVLSLKEKWRKTGLSEQQIDECIELGRTKWEKHLFPLIKKREGERKISSQSFIIPFFFFLYTFSSVKKGAACVYLEKIHSIPKDQVEEVLLLAISILKDFFPIKMIDQEIIFENVSL